MKNSSRVFVIEDVRIFLRCAPDDVVLFVQYEDRVFLHELFLCHGLAVPGGGVGGCHFFRFLQVLCQETAVRVKCVCFGVCVVLSSMVCV